MCAWYVTIWIQAHHVVVWLHTWICKRKIIHWSSTLINQCIFAVTNQDGEFSFVMTSSAISGPRNVTITPSKSSGGVLHTFEYNDVPVSSHSVYIDTLTFDKTVTFIDTAVVNFRGSVSIANTSLYNQGKPCSVESAIVCLRNALGSGETLVCASTDTDGRILVFSF
jgi:hypothetical protein